MLFFDMMRTRGPGRVINCYITGIDETLMNTEHNLLFALLAARLALLPLEEVRDLWRGWQLDRDEELADLLIAAGRLALQAPL